MYIEYKGFKFKVNLWQLALLLAILQSKQPWVVALLQLFSKQ